MILLISLGNGAISSHLFLEVLDQDLFHVGQVISTTASLRFATLMIGCLVSDLLEGSGLGRVHF